MERSSVSTVKRNSPSYSATTFLSVWVPYGRYQRYLWRSALHKRRTNVRFMVTEHEEKWCRTRNYASLCVMFHNGEPHWRLWDNAMIKYTFFALRNEMLHALLLLIDTNQKELERWHCNDNSMTDCPMYVIEHLKWCHIFDARSTTGGAVLWCTNGTRREWKNEKCILIFLSGMDVSEAKMIASC